MKIKNLYLLAFLLCLNVGCASSQKSDKSSVVSTSMEISESGDQIASEPPVYTEKRLVSVVNGKPIEYEYISNGQITAKEVLDEKGNTISFAGEMPVGLVKEYDMENNLKAELNYNAGKLEGVNKAYYSNGQVKFVKNYKDGKLDGIVREYYDNGNKKLEAGYKNGILNGTLKKYSRMGTFLSSSNYSNGKLDGVYKEFFVTGTPKIEIEYFNGLREGYSKEYFSNGTLKQELNYSQDKLQGESKVYYDDGNINKIEMYKDDKLNGDTRIFSNNNSEIPMYIDTYVDGRKIMRKAFSGKGEQIFKIKY